MFLFVIATSVCPTSQATIDAVVSLSTLEFPLFIATSIISLCLIHFLTTTTLRVHALDVIR
jgi:hypothetical protein